MAQKPNPQRAALAYAGFGYQVFPVAAQTKTPLTEHGYQDGTVEEGQITAWWERWPDANVALACAPSGCIALDVDPHKLDDAGHAFVAALEEHHPTSTQDTPTGGSHYLYRLPDGVTLGNSPGSLPKGIDVRVKGYILVSPSSVTYHGDDAKVKGVADGYSGRYAWREGLRPSEFPPQPLPEHVLALLKPKERVATPPAGDKLTAVPVYTNGSSPRYAQAALESELDILTRAPVGGRNEQLNKSAFSLGQLVASGLLDEGEVVDKLTTVSLSIGLDEREVRRTIQSGVESGKKSPRGVPEIPPVLFGTAPAPSRNGHSSNGASEPAGNAPPVNAPKPKPLKLGPTRTIQLALSDMGYTFKLNELRDRIELGDGSPLHDGQQATIVAQLFEQGVKNKTLILDVILAEAWANRYDPLRDYFGSLTWDGQDHIGLLSGWLVCKNDPMLLEDGELHSVASVWLRRWLVGAVGKALGSVQNPMLVLAGGQGIGKSELARWLCSPLPDYFVSSPIVPDNTDHLRWLAGNFIWEVAELGATTRKADIEGLKAFLTRPECTYRVPYAKNEVHRPSRASFIGTINLDNAGFLMDTTGNRRFLSVELAAIRWEAYTRNIDPNQLWAQAAHLYIQDRNGWKLSTLEEEYRDRINEGYGAEDPILDALEDLFDIVAEAEPDISPFVPTMEIVNQVASRVHEPTTRQLQLGIAKALRRLGVTKGRKGGARGVRGYWGMVRKAPRLP